jgi:hypothetical protein
MISTSNLFDEVDDGRAEVSTLDFHESLGERQAVGGREKVG